MKSLLIVLFSLFFVGEAVAAPPPGLYDNPNTVSELPAQKKKSAEAKAKAPAVPNAIMGKSDEHSFRKKPNEPLFSSPTSAKPLDDDNILGIDFDGLGDKITGMGKNLMESLMPKSKKKDAKAATDNNPPLVSAMPPVSEQQDKKSVEADVVKKAAVVSFRIPITIYNRHASEEDFLNDLYANMPDIKPKDLKLEALKAEEELKKKEEVLAAEKKRREAEAIRAKEEATKKAAEAKRAAVKKPKVKRKSKRERLVEKVYDMSIAGIKLGMTPAEVLDALQNTDFVVKYSDNSIPRFLEWQYRNECLKNPGYRKSDLQSCINDEADKAKVNYISRMDLKHRINDETMTLTFSSFYAGNKLYRIEYHTLGDNSLGYSDRDMYFRVMRARDFMQRLRKRYGNPDDVRNMVWGSDKDAVTLRAFVSGENIDGSIILEDARIEARDENTMVQSANRLHYGDNFNF